MACAVHSALRAAPTRGARVLVSGAGSVGLLTTLALRELTDAGEIIVVAKHGHQRELAVEFGATEVVTPEGGAAARTPARAAPSSWSRTTPGATSSVASTSPSTRSAARSRSRPPCTRPRPAAGWSSPGCPPPPTCPPRGSASSRSSAPTPRPGLAGTPDGRGDFDIAMELVGHDAVARMAKSVAPLSPPSLARGPRPRAVGRPARHRQGRVRPQEARLTPCHVQDSCSRWTTGPLPCSSTRASASGWRTSRSARGWSTRPSRCPPWPTSTRRSARRCSTRPTPSRFPRCSRRACG